MKLRYAEYQPDNCFIFSRLTFIKEHVVKTWSSALLRIIFHHEKVRTRWKLL